MCTTAVDALRLPFTCATADGTPLGAALNARHAALPGRVSRSAHARPPLSWRDVAAGLMLTHGVVREGGGASGRARLERELLLRARSTWMPQAEGLDKTDRRCGW